MKQVILLITTFLFVQCEILDSSDVDENYEKWNEFEWGEGGESEEYEKWVYEEIN